MASEFIEGKYYDCHEIFTELGQNHPRNAAIICNKAAAQYGLELYRGCVADCNVALEIDPLYLQAYILKGYALMRCSGKVGGLKNARKAWKAGLDRFLQAEVDGNPQGISGDVLLGSQLSALAHHPSPPPLQLGALPSPVPPPAPPVATAVEKREAALSEEKKRSEGTSTDREPDRAKLAVLEAFSQQTIAALGLNSAILSQAREGLQFCSGIEFVDNLISIGYLHVNAGNHKLATEIFERVLVVFPRLAGALLGIGSAKAFSGDIDGAIEHFSQAIKAEPTAADAWKRRAQSFASQGKLKQALSDINRALELPNDDLDLYNQRGIIYAKLQNYEQAKKDLKKVVAGNKKEKMAWNQLGLIEGFLGDVPEGLRCFDRAIEIDPTFIEAHMNRAQIIKEKGEGPEALQRFRHILQIDPSNCDIISLTSECHYSMGEIQKALEVAESAFKFESGNIKCRLCAGSSTQCLGRYSDAVKHYDLVLASNPSHHCFYQREMALTCWALLDRPFEEYNLDILMNRTFKDAWCKKHNPITSLHSYQRKTVPSNIQDVEQSLELPEDLIKIRTVAQKLGRDLQLPCTGFMPNRRQHLMAGLSIIEIFQTLTKHWQDLRSGGGGLQVSNAKSSQADKYAETETHTHLLSYRDIFDIAARWRQLSEPGDTVWWIDKLPYEAFSEGFGLQTPMLTGQLHVIRYNCYFDKSFALMKQLMAEQCNLRSSDIPLLHEMKDLKSLHDLIGHDFYVVTPCHSTAVPGRIMEGTRLTIVGHEPGYIFSIRTAGTPDRYEQFDEEMTYIFKQLDEAVCAAPEDHCTDRILDIAISIFYYWVHFAPLSRGSAACGYVIMFAVLHSVGYQLVEPMKKGVQWDWEAILSPSPDVFSAMIKPWLQSKTAKRLENEDKDSRETFLTTIRQFADIGTTYCMDLRSSISLLNSAGSWLEGEL